MDDDQQFCLRWNNHQSTLVSVFDTLLEKGIHVDCTLAAEGQTLKAHKVVLSACSPYFESVLSQQYDKHPIIILKDVKYAELRAMMDYMYRGEVNISQDQLAALLKAAESLQIKGLSDNKPSRPPSRPPPPAAPAPLAPLIPIAPLAPLAPLTPIAPLVPIPPISDAPTQPTESSIDSREGSLSPTRRRKKRRLSLETGADGRARANGSPCKREGAAGSVEDLTLDEEPPAAPHGDVVRNFQWHMERSQDEIMNSNDSARDSQGGRPTRSQSKLVTQPPAFADEPSKTFAILKNVKKPPERAAEDSKENKKQPPGSASSESRDSSYNALPGEDSPRFPFAKAKEKGHKCPNCQRAYNARRNLVRHVTLECGREPQYKCPHCAAGKHRRNELKNHIAKKHPHVARSKQP